MNSRRSREKKMGNNLTALFNKVAFVFDWKKRAKAQ